MRYILPALLMASMALAETPRLRDQTANFSLPSSATQWHIETKQNQEGLIQRFYMFNGSEPANLTGSTARLWMGSSQQSPDGVFLDGVVYSNCAEFVLTSSFLYKPVSKWYTTLLISNQSYTVSQASGLITILNAPEIDGGDLDTTRNISWKNRTYKDTAEFGPVRPDNISITSITNEDGSITISAEAGVAVVVTDSTLTGDGSVANPLGVDDTRFGDAAWSDVHWWELSKTIEATNLTFTFDGYAQQINATTFDLIPETSVRHDVTCSVYITSSSYIVGVDFDLIQSVAGMNFPTIQTSSERITNNTWVIKAWCSDLAINDPDVWFATISNLVVYALDRDDITPYEQVNDSAGVIARVDDPLKGDQRAVVNVGTMEKHLEDQRKSIAQMAWRLTPAGHVAPSADYVTLDQPVIFQGQISYFVSGDYYCASYDGAFENESNSSAWRLGPAGRTAFEVNASGVFLRIESFTVTNDVAYFKISTNGVTSYPVIEGVASLAVPQQWLTCDGQTMVDNGDHWLGSCPIPESGRYYFRAIDPSGVNRLISHYPHEFKNGIILGGSLIENVVTNEFDPLFSAWVTNAVGTNAIVDGVQVDISELLGGETISNLLLLRDTANQFDVQSEEVGIYRAIRPGGIPTMMFNVDGYEIGCLDILGFTIRIGNLHILSNDINANVQAFDGTASTPAYSWQGEPTMGKFRFSYDGDYAEGFVKNTNLVWFWDKNGIHLTNGSSLFGIDIPVAVGTYPCFDISLGSHWTDFEIKASTNNFESLVYYYKSWTTQDATRGDTNAMVYFTDDYADDVRKWNLKPQDAPISSELVSSNSYVANAIFMPSHECAIDWQLWMNEDNTNLVWSYVRVDDLGFEQNVDKTKQRWRAIEPCVWKQNRTIAE